VVEGPTLLRAALEAGAAVESAYVAPGATGRPETAGLLAQVHEGGGRIFELAPGVLERVAGTVTPQPLLAVVAVPRWDDGVLGGATFVVVCVDVRDPGNAGAVIRAADAAGADAVVCCRGTADPYNPKTVRASAGSVLHLPVLCAGAPAEALDAVGRRGLRRLAAVASGGRAHVEVDLRSPLALVLGNEASGLPDELAPWLDERVSIEMGGGAESLNVAQAAAVLCFEVRRQRSSSVRPVEDAQGAERR
jgi:TrmH family RNA methyltransferase